MLSWQPKIHSDLPWNIMHPLPPPVMLHLKFDQNGPTNLWDFLVKNVKGVDGRRTTEPPYTINLPCEPIKRLSYLNFLSVYNREFKKLSEQITNGILFMKEIYFIL